MTNIFIVAAKRTPFGAFGGALKSLSATELGVVSTKAALAQGNIDPTTVDSIYFGNVIQSSADACYLARHVGLQSGIPIPVPALTVNRLCGSGFETVIQGCKDIALGMANITLCGGTENMSAAPLQASGNAVRFGVPLGKGLSLEDSLWSGLTDSYSKTAMGVTAENLATKYDISRQECDEFAIRSQQTWGMAHEEGIFDHEIAPVEIVTKKGTTVVDTDEHPRPDSTLEKISTLKPVFAKDGVVTAANASGICDGAGSIVLASQQAVDDHGLKPMARIVSYAVTGCPPEIMGIGPVSAIQQALDKGGLTFADVDRFEINEAFASQALSCFKELDLDMSKTNLHGGAISLGHPLGASGSRITAHLANEFSWSDKGNVHVGAACIGGGQGIAVVMERV